MTYENIKNIILVILVVLSGVLTWTLWTYQPNLELLENLKTLKEEPIGPTNEFSKLVLPEKVVYHYPNNEHYGTVDIGEINKTINEIKEWNLTDFEDRSSEADVLISSMYEPGNTVITYPDNVPIEQYQNVIAIDEEVVLTFDFDHIVINSNNLDREDGIVYFISKKSNTVYQSHVRASLVQSFKDKYFENSIFNENFSEYFRYQPSAGTTIFIPSGERQLVKYQYLSEEFDSDRFKNLLFSEPTIVQKNVQSTMEEFTDSSSLLRVMHDSNTISYINFDTSTEWSPVDSSLLSESIDYVNSHGGWTDNYRYDSFDQASNRVVFRQYELNGYPIFSDSSSKSTVQVSWSQGKFREYRRSNFSFDAPLSDHIKVDLPSGESVVNHLESLEGIELDQLEDIAIGYKMTKDPQTKLIYLDPSWYYLYGGNWIMLSMEETGGINRGLE
ncbi:YycH family regulatory protein [Bacillus mesophilum]|uniref:Regulatory protein YycH domain-containing protein n=1 Tax=Bacillus mesophilum TaxID=1071718 RepID=A0A7V7RIR9_9BACI|nr:two-component system activity regulator YycH [Bacillus mesophilum]KAB2330287.1 hypothetical protein F7732_19230 [Bacillus mesophilum]